MELARYKGPKSDAQRPGRMVSSPTHQLEGLGSAVNFLQWDAGRSSVRPSDLERFMGLQSRSWSGFTFISVKFLEVRATEDPLNQIIWGGPHPRTPMLSAPMGTMDGNFGCTNPFIPSWVRP